MNKYEGFSVGAIVTVLLGCLALVWLAAGNYAARHKPVPTKAAQTEPAPFTPTPPVGSWAGGPAVVDYSGTVKPPKAAKRPKDSFPLEILQPGWSIICLNFDSKRRVIEPAYDNPDCQPGGKFHPSTEWKNSPFVIPPEGPNLICESYPCSLAPDDPGSHSGPKLPPWATSTLAPPESGILVPAPQVDATKGFRCYNADCSAWSHGDKVDPPPGFAPNLPFIMPVDPRQAVIVDPPRFGTTLEWRIAPEPQNANRTGIFTDLAPALREFPPFGPVDVPPVKVTTPPSGPCNLPSPVVGNVTLDVCVTGDETHYTCADKSRYLLTSEDGTRHCIRIGEKP